MSCLLLSVQCVNANSRFVNQSHLALKDQLIKFSSLILISTTFIANVIKRVGSYYLLRTDSHLIVHKPNFTFQKMSKLTFCKLKSASGSKTLIHNLKSLQEWYLVMQPHKLYRELSSKNVEGKVFCLKRDEIIAKLKDLYPPVNQFPLKGEYEEGEIEPRKVTSEVLASWVEQLEAELNSTDKYYLCLDAAIRQGLPKGFKAAERHAEQIKLTNRNNRVQDKAGWRELRKQFLGQHFDEVVRVNKADYEKIEKLKEGSYENVYFSAIKFNHEKIRATLTKKASGKHLLQRKGEVRVIGENAKGDVTFTLRWDVKKKHPDEKRLRSFKSMLNKIRDFQGSLSPPKYQLPVDFASILSDTTLLEENSKVVCLKMTKAAAAVGLSREDLELTNVRELLDVIEKRVLGENTSDTYTQLETLIRKEFSKLPLDDDGRIDTKVTEKYFNKLTEYLECLERVLTYDKAKATPGVGKDRNSPDSVAKLVLQEALKHDYAEPELLDLRKEYFNSLSGAKHKEFGLSELQEKLQTTVQYIVSKRPEKVESSKPGSKRARSQGGLKSKRSKKKRKKNKKKKREASSSNSDASSSSDDGGGEKVLLSVDDFSKLDEDEKRQAVNTYLQSKNGCFKYGKTGKCSRKKCRYKHIKLPSHMKLKKKAKASESSKKSSSSLPKHFINQVKKVVQQITDADKKKKDEVRALEAAHTDKIWKRLNRSMKKDKYSKSERAKFKRMVSGLSIESSESDSSDE